MIVDFVDWSADDGWDCKRIPKNHVSGINSVQYGKMGRGKVYSHKQFQTSVGASSASIKFFSEFRWAAEETRCNVADLDHL